MRPVDLTPTDTAVAVSSGGQSHLAIGAVVGALAVAVLVYFGFAHVNTMKEQSDQLTLQAQQATDATAQKQAELTEAGQAQGIDYAQIASTKEQQVLEALGARVDYARLERELAAVRPVGSWFTSIVANASGDGESAVTIHGFVADPVDIATLVQRINSTKTMKDAQPGTTEQVTSDGGRTYWKFEITAGLEGVETDSFGQPIPSSGLVGGPTGSGSSGGSEAEGLSLHPKPGYGAKKKKSSKPVAKAVQPPSALETAAEQAAKGAS